MKILFGKKGVEQWVVTLIVTLLFMLLVALFIVDLKGDGSSIGSGFIDMLRGIF
jgi:hypothetical protein